jgi:hypothetical protein
MLAEADWNSQVAGQTFLAQKGKKSFHESAKPKTRQFRRRQMKRGLALQKKIARRRTYFTPCCRQVRSSTYFLVVETAFLAAFSAKFNFRRKFAWFDQ